MRAAIEHLVDKGCKRIAVCGGDGTLALAASCLVGTDVELGVLPGGTLNHFAANLQIPTCLSDALELAINGRAKTVSVGYVNEQLFLNTSSVGAYVFFVRKREQLEKRMSYSFASLTAGVVRLIKFRSAKMDLNGSLFRSPLVFVGINERELQFPILGQKKADGAHGLHVIAIRSQSRLSSLKIAAKAFFFGVDPLERANEVENLLLRSLQLAYHSKSRKLTVAVDGELVRLRAPLRYRYEENALSVIVPRPPLRTPTNGTVEALVGKYRG